MDSYFVEREKYLDSMARSKAMCIDKLRHHDCRAWECPSCEKRRLWDECVEGMDSYSKLMLADKVEAAAGNIAAAHPTYEEAVEQVESERRIRRNAFIQAQRDVDWEWWHGGGWVSIAAMAFALIFVPIIGCMEWFL